jgi:hypothetical protein
MRKLILRMSTTLDGVVAGEDDEMDVFDFSSEGFLDRPLRAPAVGRRHDPRSRHARALPERLPSPSSTPTGC